MGKQLGKWRRVTQSDLLRPWRCNSGLLSLLICATRVKAVARTQNWKFLHHYPTNVARTVLKLEVLAPENYYSMLMQLLHCRNSVTAIR